MTLVESPAGPAASGSGTQPATERSLRQLGLFADGDAPSPITHYKGDRSSLAYLDYFRRPPHCPIICKTRTGADPGHGRGSGIPQANYHATRQIHAVELNPWLPQLLQHKYAEFSGWKWLRGNTRLYTGEARSFVSTDAVMRYDLIQMSLLDVASAPPAAHTA